MMVQIWCTRLVDLISLVTFQGCLHCPSLLNCDLMTFHSSSTRAISPPPPVIKVATESYSAVVASTSCTPVKRKPGRPRKYSDNQQQDAKARSDVHKVTIKPMKRPKLKLDTDCGVDDGSEEDVKVANSNNGDLSPPVLEPMCTSPKEKSYKISDLLSPPTLIANKKLLYVGSPRGLLPEKEHKRPSEFAEGKAWYRLTSDVSN